MQLFHFERSRRVTPDIEPGYLSNLVPLVPPKTGENWDTIMGDIESKIMPGITHWQHPRFHAYFPAGNSYPSILGDMLSSGLGILGFSWASSPACTELETIVLQWLGVMSGLDKSLLPFETKQTDSLDFSNLCSVNSMLNKNLSVMDEDNSSNKTEMTLHSGGGVLLVLTRLI